MIKKKQNRVAFIIESTQRTEKAVAHKFYRGAGSRWIDSILGLISEYNELAKNLERFSKIVS